MGDVVQAAGEGTLKSRLGYVWNDQQAQDILHDALMELWARRDKLIASTADRFARFTVLKPMRAAPKSEPSCTRRSSVCRKRRFSKTGMPFQSRLPKRMCASTP